MAGKEPAPYVMRNITYLQRKLKKELAASSATPGAILKNAGDLGKQPPPYFYNGMMSTEESEGRDI